MLHILGRVRFDYGPCDAELLENYSYL